MSKPLPSLPSSWSDLTWQQLWDCWMAKLRYGGNPDAARCAALLALTLGSNFRVSSVKFDEQTGEQTYMLTPDTGEALCVTPRQLAHLAKKALPWFDYPYGDRGDEAVKDEKGKVIKEARDPVRGYVNPSWRDAMQLPEERIVICGNKTIAGSEWDSMSEIKRQQILQSSPFTLHFSIPQLACNNLTWEQYRSIQPLVPQIWQQDISEEQALLLQAQFTAYCLVPEQVQTEQTTPLKDRFRPAHTFKFDSERAEQSVPFWQKQIESGSVIFHVCFQVYQTAIQYYETVYPLLFGGGGKEDPLRDALTGEVGTINAVMKYAGYRTQQEVYESYLPHVFDILNTMSKEAKEIEKMNSKIKRK